MKNGFAYALLWLLPVAAHSQDAVWTLTPNVSYTHADFSGSRYRDNLQEAALSVTVDKRDRAGLTLGATSSTLNYLSGDTLEQRGQYGSARWYWLLAPGWGRVTFRGDALTIKTEEGTLDVGDSQTYAAQVGYLAAQEDLYWDLGYTRSIYDDYPHVRQLTPTVGMAFDDYYFWLQLRGYFIEIASEPTLETDQRTRALETKLTHWLKSSDQAWMPNNLQVAWLGGERLYAYDPDAMGVYNLPYTQKNSGYVGLGWQLQRTANVTLLTGSGQFESDSLEDSYRARFVFLNLSNAW